MESSSEFSERSGSSLSWSDCNDAPAERNEDWDFVLPRSKTHVAPDFSASEEEEQSPAQDCEEDYQLVQGQEESHQPAQDRQEDYQFIQGFERDHQPPAQDHEEAPCTAASPEPSNIEAEAEDQTQTTGAECESEYLDYSSTSATDETPLNESYFTKEEALKSLRSEFNATNKFEPSQLADAEGWLDYLYDTLAPSFPPKETELDKDMRQLSVAIFLERQLKLYFYPGDNLTLKAIAYRHMLRPSNARVAKLLSELSKRAKFTGQPSHVHLKWQISGLQQGNKKLLEKVTYVEQMNQQFQEDNDSLVKKNDELKKKNLELENKYSQIKMMNGELEKMNLQLEKMNLQLEKKNDQLFMKNDQVGKKNEQLEKKNDQLEKKNDELETVKEQLERENEVKRKVELFEDRLDVERAVNGTFNESFNAALAKALGAFSKVLDEKLDEKTETFCKCPQDSAPIAAPSTTKVEAARKPALRTYSAADRAAAVKERNDRIALRAADRAAAIRERHDRAARRVTAMKGGNTKAIDSARIKAQKNSGDRGSWLQSGSSGRNVVARSRLGGESFWYGLRGQLR